MATETFKLNFAINCLWIRNVAIFFYNCESFAPNLPWSESDLHLYTRWLKMCYSRSVLMFFLALKTFCLMLRLEHSMRTCLGFLVAAWPTLCDTAISCGWSGGRLLWQHRGSVQLHPCRHFQVLRNAFNCLCISLEIRSANSCRLCWIICFNWPLISGDLRAAPRHKIKWSASILS